MFKPTLKRSKASINFDTLPFEKSFRLEESTPTKNNDKQLPEYPIPLSIIPRKMLSENSQGFFNLNHLITSPLISNFYQYPQTIKKYLYNQEQETHHRGIYQFNQVFYYFHNNNLVLWNYKDSKHFDQIYQEKEYQFDSEIYGATYGKLKDVGNVLKQQNMDIFAIAFCSLIKIYELTDRRQLQLKDLHLSISTEYSLTKQQLLISNNNQIFYGGSTRLLSMFSFKQALKKVIPLTFSQRFFRGIFTKPKYETVEQIIATQNRVYCLIKKDQKKGWPFISKCTQTVKNWLKGRQSSLSRSTHEIDIYSLQNGNKMKLQRRIQQDQLAERIKNNYSELNQIDNVNQQFQIKSIYFDKTYKSLGVVLKCGYFVIIKQSDDGIKFWKEPQNIPRYPSNFGLHVIHIPSKGIQGQRQVLKSCGYNSLTLLNDMIFYLDSKNFFMTKCRNIIGEISEIQDYQNQSKISLFNPNRKWILFFKKGFYLIVKPEPRDILFTYSLIEPKPVKFFVHREDLLAKKCRQMGLIYGFAEVCSYLMEIIMADVSQIYVNIQFRNYIEQLGERGSFENWQVDEDQPRTSAGYCDHLSKQVKEKIWKLLMEYQYKKIQLKSQATQKRGQQPQTNLAIWYSLQFLFYKSINTILEWTPKQFNQNKSQTIQAKRRLTNLGVLLKQKEKRQAHITKSSIIQRLLNYQQDYNNSFESTNLNNSNSQIIINKQEPINNVIDSSLKLVQVLQTAIPKIILMIQIYEIIADADTQQNKRLPKFSNILFQNSSRTLIQERLIKCLPKANKNEQFLEKINSTIPQFQIQRDQIYINWRNHLPKINPQNVNIQKLSKVIKLQNLKQLQQYFKQYKQYYVFLIVSKIKQLQRQIQQLQCRQHLYDHKNYFQRQQQKLLDQNRYTIQIEIIDFNKQLKRILEKIFNQKLIQSYQLKINRIIDQNQFKSQKCSQKILNIIINYGNLQIKQFLQQLLKKNKLKDYLIHFWNKNQSPIKNNQQFKYHNKKKFQQMSTNQIMEYIKQDKTIRKQQLRFEINKNGLNTIKKGTSYFKDYTYESTK